MSLRAILSIVLFMAVSMMPAAFAGDKTNVYFLSGLGADERVFNKLKLDTSQFNVVHVKWIEPEKKESLQSYASRLTAQIDTTKPFKLVGLSFGGIMASVLAEQIHPEKIILISSTPTFEPLSGFYRGLIKLVLFHPLSGPVLKSANRFTYRYFGADTPELKALLKQILKDTDTHFLKWALTRMSSWNHPNRLPGIYHMHGTADKLIAPKLVHPDKWIEGGTHLMVYSKHEEISDILNAELLN